LSVERIGKLIFVDGHAIRRTPSKPSAARCEDADRVSVSVSWTLAALSRFGGQLVGIAVVVARAPNRDAEGCDAVRPTG
jgi:hypothetical protein